MKDFIIINGKKIQILNGFLDLGWKKIKDLSNIVEFDNFENLK